MPFAVLGILDGGDAGSKNQSQGYVRAKESLMRQVLQSERTGWSKRVSQQGTEGSSNPDGWGCFVQAPWVQGFRAPCCFKGATGKPEPFASRCVDGREGEYGEAHLPLHKQGCSAHRIVHLTLVHKHMREEAHRNVSRLTV